MAVDLSVEFCGIKFKNPFLLSSSPASRTEVLKKAAAAGWAGAVTWGGEMLLPVDIEPNTQPLSWYTLPSKIKLIARPPSVWSFQVSSSRPGYRLEDPSYPVKAAERTVRRAKESGVQVIIANISGGLSPDSWLATTAAAEKAGADMLELNFSYAIVPGRGMHLGWHRDLDKTRAVIKAVKDRTSIPIMVKLNAFLIPQEIKDWARACQEAGANAISISNSMPGFAGVDIETGLPLSACLEPDGSIRGAVEIITGPATKPVTMAGVALVASAVDIPIAAIGGVEDWQDAVEYIMLGASIVMVGSAAIAYGHRLAKELTQGLTRFMERKGYQSTTEFRGITSQRYQIGKPYSLHALNEKQPRNIVVDEVKCNGCGKCVPPCQVYRGAMQIVDGLAVINRDLCQKCNLCALVCPEGAIRIEWDIAPSFNQ